MDLTTAAAGASAAFIIIATHGYADSTDAEVSELGVVTDAMEIFRWVHKRANRTPIFGWSHSLGTGIGAHAYSLLEKEGLYPNGLILSDELREFPLTKIHRILPLFEFFMVEPVEKNNIIFDTETNLMNTKMPILILHARDDIIIPYQQGEKLYKHLLETRKNVITELVLYDKNYKKFINESLNNLRQ